MDLINVEVVELDGNPVIEVKITGDLTEDNYKQAMPKFETALKANADKSLLLIDARHMQGVSLSTLWDDMKNTTDKIDDLKKVAFLGDSAIEKAATTVFGALSSVDVKYFTDREKAVAWLS
jgi:hypothetical protein